MDVPGTVLHNQLTEHSPSARVTQRYKRPQRLQVALAQLNIHQTHLGTAQTLYWKLIIMIGNNFYIYLCKSLFIIIFNHL